MKTGIICSGFLYSLLLISPVAGYTQEEVEEVSDDDVVSVYDRTRPDYEADGVPAGGFIIRPSANVKTTYSDNIFAVSSGEDSDLIFSFAPAVNVESNWNRHELYLGVDGDVVRYGDNSGEDYEGYSVSAGGRADILRGTYLTGDLSHATRYEGRDSPNDVNGTEPTEFTDSYARAGFVRNLRRISLVVDGQARNLDFDNVPAAGGGVIDNSTRDRDEYKTGLRIGYEYIPNYQAFARFDYDWRSYDVTAPLNRDSDGYSIKLGTAVNFTGKLKGEVFAGYLTQSYDDPALSDIDSAIFGGDLLWNATSITSVKVGLEQSVMETIVAGASGYLDTEFFAAVEHELQRNIFLGGSLGYSNQDYEGTSREDEVIRAGAEAKYLFRRGVAAKAGYNFVERDSNIAGNDFTDSRFVLNIELEL